MIHAFPMRSTSNTNNARFSRRPSGILYVLCAQPNWTGLPLPPKRSSEDSRLQGGVFRSAKKIYEVAQRGDGFIDMESREALDEAVALGRGGI